MNGPGVAEGMDPIVRAMLAMAWEEGRCAAARGVRSNPYVDDKPSKDGED